MVVQISNGKGRGAEQAARGGEEMKLVQTVYGEGQAKNSSWD